MLYTEAEKPLMNNHFLRFEKVLLINKSLSSEL